MKAGVGGGIYSLCLWVWESRTKSVQGNQLCWTDSSLEEAGIGRGTGCSGESRNPVGRGFPSQSPGVGFDL